MIYDLIRFIDQSRNRYDNPPLVGLVGFGTWAKLIGSIQANQTPDMRLQDGLSDYLLVNQTRIMRDPYTDDGVVILVQGAGRAADVRIFEGLDSEHPKVVLR